MNARVPALWLSLAVLAIQLPAVAQGLRPSAPLPVRPATNEPRPADFIVAVVNSEPITNNEVRTRMARFEQELAQQGQGVPPRGEFGRQVLERMISEKSQLQLARENNFRVEDGAVDQAEQNIARQNGYSVTELRRRMISAGMDPSQFRSELRDQLTLQRMREREVDNRVRVGDLELDQFIDELKRLGADPANQEVNLGHILVVVPERASEVQIGALRDKAMRALQRARAGEDFAKLAQEFSDAQAAGANGMPTGMRAPERIPGLFLNAVDKVAVGGYSDLVRSDAGFHIIKVFERKQGGLPSSVVQTHARHILLRPGPQLTEAQAIQRLAEYKRRVTAGQADFAQLARENSQDASAKEGGDLGWASPGLFVPEFEEAITALQPGQVGDPMISRFGVHLIQVLERRQGTLTAREQRDIARNMLRERKLDEAYINWAREVRGKAYVEYREPPN